jgi:hypothetical protein
MPMLSDSGYPRQRKFPVKMLSIMLCCNQFPTHTKNEPPMGATPPLESRDIGAPRDTPPRTFTSIPCIVA